MMPSALGNAEETGRSADGFEAVFPPEGGVERAVLDSRPLHLIDDRDRESVRRRRPGLRGGELALCGVGSDGRGGCGQSAVAGGDIGIRAADAAPPCVQISGVPVRPGHAATRRSVRACSSLISSTTRVRNSPG